MKPVTRIIEILAVEPYRITCLFNDKSLKTIDFANYLNRRADKALVSPLLNPSYFMNVTLDELGGLHWPNGFDCSPLAAYELGEPIAVSAELYYA
jgi:hypothetical protein